MTTQEPGQASRPPRWRLPIAAACVLLLVGTIAWIGRKLAIAEAQGRAAQAALRLGAAVEFAFSFEGGDPDGPRIPGAAPAAPAFLNRDVVGLFLSGPRWQDADLAVLEDLPYLVKLSLGSLPSVGDPGMSHLAGCSGLRRLDINDLPLLTDRGLAPIASLTGLRELKLQNVAIGDAGLDPLLGLQRLEALTLSMTRVTDAGLRKLHAMGGLKRLVLRGKRVTAGGIAALRTARPGLEIDAR